MGEDEFMYALLVHCAAPCSIRWGPRQAAAEVFLPLAEVFVALELDDGGGIVPGHIELVVAALVMTLYQRSRTCKR